MTSWWARLLGRAEPSRRAPSRGAPARPRPAAAPAAAVRNDRRSTRVVVRAPVSLTRDGRSITAITAVVNDEGGLFLSPEDWPVGAECKVKHLDTGRAARARVVWNGGLDELG